MDPEAMVGFMVDRILRDLRVSREEEESLRPALTNLMKARMEQGRGMAERTEALREAVEAKDADGMASSLKALKSKRGELRARLEKAEGDLRGMLTDKMEVRLTVRGVVNTDESALPPPPSRGRRGPPRGGMPTLPIRETEDILKELKLEEEKAAEIGPKIGELQDARRKQKEERRKDFESLLRARRGRGGEVLGEVLARIREAGKKTRERLDRLEKALTESLPLEIEARLTVMGVVNGGVSFPGGPPGGGPGGRGEDLTPRFDKDKDGKLNDAERKEARAFARSRGGRRRGTGGGRARKEPATLNPEDVKPCDPGAGLFDEGVLRTLFLRFKNEDWWEELSDFYRTGVDVPAELVVDGKAYAEVGIRFRGNSSFMMGRNSDKKPFNISIDHGDPNQRLYGYRTINLLNAHTDPSFMRAVIYYRICRDYIPAPKANFIRLVINGENFGVFPSLEQFNNDFVREWFGTRGGVRWKIPPGRSSVSALGYVGSNPESYMRAFELKNGDKKKAWADLVKLCEALSKTPDGEIEETLKPLFNIDRALWLIAIENAFIDGDGYISRGSDYCLYQDPAGRFHMLPYDDNETFGYAGGRGGPNEWPPGTDRMLSPVAWEGSTKRPVIQRLLAVPALRARYLAHYRTLVDEWVNWDRFGPVAEKYHALIDPEVKKDNKNIHPYDAFADCLTKDYTRGGGFPGRGGFGRRGGGHGSAPAFKKFITERREYLLNHPAFKKEAPVIRSVSAKVKGAETGAPVAPKPDEAVTVLAEIGGEVKAEAVLLYFSPGWEMPFTSTPMFDDGAHGDGKAEDGTFGGEIPPHPLGSHVHYYVEARASASTGTTTFHPPRAEFQTHTFRVASPAEGGSDVVINELMAANVKGFKDPQGDPDDWIELHNRGRQAVDLSGMYLSDSRYNPRKWKFPDGTVLPPGGYLIVWADEDTKAKEGLHANFKLSRGGERIILVDRDEKKNRILDRIEFGKQKEDTAFGRVPDGTGDFRPLAGTPGKKNGP
jgi:hypothetical protein